MGKQGGGGHGGAGSSGARKGGAGCGIRSSCFGLAFVVQIITFIYVAWLQQNTPYLKEAGMFLYIKLDHWWLGLSQKQAWKDTLYGYGMEAQHPVFREAIDETRRKGGRKLATVLATDDNATVSCKVAYITQMVSSIHINPPDAYNLDTMDPVTTQEKVDLFLDACKDVFRNLPPANFTFESTGAQRAALESLVPFVLKHVKDHGDHPFIVEGVTTPTLIKGDFSADGMAKMRMNRDAEAARRPSLDDRWKKKENIQGTFDKGASYRDFNLHPVEERIIKASEISDAIRNGVTARFDAKELLGEEIFKLSMPDVAALHGEEADTIPMYRQQGASAPGKSGMESLTEYAKRIGLWDRDGRVTFPENRPWRSDRQTEVDKAENARSYYGPTWWLDLLARFIGTITSQDVRSVYRQVRNAATQCAVNTRRLPKLPFKHGSVEEALGNPEWLERAWSMFWLGAVSDCWHYDDPDNLLIAVHGEMYVTVFEQQDAHIMRAGGDRGCWSQINNLPHTFTASGSARENQWVNKFPFITLKLEPGQGIVVPSMTYHSLTMPDGARILMNCFMMPKFHGLHTAPVSNQSFYNKEKQSITYEALRSLKLSSIYRLWDTKKIGGFFEATKLEVM